MPDNLDLKTFEEMVAEQNASRAPGQEPPVPPFREGTIVDNGTDVEVVPHDSSTPVTKTEPKSKK